MSIVLSAHIGVKTSGASASKKRVTSSFSNFSRSVRLVEEAMAMRPAESPVSVGVTG